MTKELWNERRKLLVDAGVHSRTACEAAKYGLGISEYLDLAPVGAVIPPRSEAVILTWQVLGGFLELQVYLDMPTALIWMSVDKDIHLREEMPEFNYSEEELWLALERLGIL